MKSKRKYDRDCYICVYQTEQCGKFFCKLVNTKIENTKFCTELLPIWEARKVLREYKNKCTN